MYYKVSVALEYQPEDYYVVTSEDFPGLVTDGRTIDEALENAADAFVTLLETYESLGRSLPDSVVVDEFPSAKFKTITPKDNATNLCFQTAVSPSGSAFHTP